MKVAQDLLIKKLGDLLPHKSHDSEVNVESFSQHLGNLVNKIEMEAL
jgi:hypothetical protein